MLAANEEYATELAAEWTRLRLSGAGEPEPLVIAVLTGACMAAFHAGRRVQILEIAGQGPDHPIHPAIPETRYLKSVIARVHR